MQWDVWRCEAPNNLMEKMGGTHPSVCMSLSVNTGGRYSAITPANATDSEHIAESLPKTGRPEPAAYRINCMCVGFDLAAAKFEASAALVIEEIWLVSSLAATRST